MPSNSVVVSGEQKIILKDDPMDNRFYSYHDKWVYFDNGHYHEVTDSVVIESLNDLQLIDND